MKNDKKIYVFDVGNTLVEKPNNCMVSEIANDITHLQKSGNLIGIATMRNLAMLSELTEQVNFDFIIALNGAYVECRDKILIDSPIENSDLIQILDIVETNRLKYKLYSKFDIHNTFVQEERIFGIELFNCTNIIDSIKDKFPSYSFYIWEKGKSCDIHNSIVSKSIGMMKVCDFYKIPIQNSIAFGDGFNDIELLQLCEVSVAMETAPNELKSVATYITKSVRENGISWALKHYDL